MEINIITYIAVGVGIFFALWWVTKVISFHYRQSYEKRAKKKEAKRLEKEKWKYCHITLDNPLLQRIIQSRFIIVKGGWGKGKSILMNIIAHYLYAYKDKQDKRNARYYKYMQPDYLIQRQDLVSNKLLPVYSNLEFVGKDELKSQDLIPYITLQKRAVQGAIFCIDEFASLFPKEMYYEVQGASNPMVEEMKELFKKFRHYTNGWILGTEQDGQDIFIGFRKNGYLTITALGTIVKLSNKGKVIRWMLNALNALLPGILTTNLKRLLEQQLFDGDKVKIILKSLLPKAIGLPVQYYTRKQEISKQVKKKYQKYQTRLALDDGSEWVITYTNKDIFGYNTRAYSHEYADKFTASGERKEE